MFQWVFSVAMRVTILPTTGMAGCHLLVVLVAAFHLCRTSAVNETLDDGTLVKFNPAQMDGLVLGKTETIYVETTSITTECLRLRCAVVRTDVVDLVGGGNVTACAGPPSNASLYHLTVHGLLLGRTSLECKVDKDGHSKNNTIIGKYSIVVIRKVGVIDVVFFISLNIVVACINIGMGCAIDLKVVKEVLRRPVAPAIGFFSQFLVMPLLAYIIIKAFGFTHETALGFFAVGCSPGGGYSNMFTLLLRGDVSLSITMTFISNVVCVVMMPLWFFTLGQTLLDGDAQITLPFSGMALSFAAFTVPLVIGILVSHFKPGIASGIRKGLRPFFVIVLVATTVIGLYIYSYLFTMFTVAILVAGCCLPYAGFLLGAVLSVVCRQSFVRVLTIAIETGIQNTIVGCMVLINCLPYPEVDIALVGPSAAGLAMPLPLFVAVAAQEIWRRCCDGKPDVAPDGAAREGVITTGDKKTITSNNTNNQV